ncbi:molecular chaperone [Citrobacter arsenatis]|uniref:fimbrial biogenesis chaperone n=1 Tax=Citrobacter arsenatis TaxID=2546350 RepID=UPI00300E54B5
MNNILRSALLLLITSPAFATIQLNANRIIYYGADADAKIVVKNTEQREYLIQSWVDENKQSTAQMPFIVTPPLFKMDEQSENVVQLIYNGQGLPDNRESLYWLDIKAIPSMTESEKNAKDKIVVAVVNRLKLIYRPSGLSGDPQQAVQQLQWSVKHPGSVVASNNSPYFIILNKISLNGHELPIDVTTNNTVIAPFSSKEYVKPAGDLKIDWSGMNDYGVASPIYSTTLH